MLIKNQSLRTPVSIELTPVIDMVFLLLIFFLVATTFQQEEREMQIALPEAASGGPIAMALREIVLNVQTDGTVIVGGRPMAVEDVRVMIEEAVASNPQQKVTVRADRDASYASVVTVLDACKGAGIREPFLDTVPLR